MQELYDEFESRRTVVIAIAQEDRDLKSHGKLLKKFGSGPRFDVVMDLEREKTTRYHRTTAYLIDRKGIVRQIFPMMIHARSSWRAILHEIDRLQGPGA